MSGPANLRLGEVRLAADQIREHADDDANIIFGASFSESLDDDVLVTLIATGLNGHGQAGTARVVAPSGAIATPVVEAKGPPKRPARVAKEASPVEAITPSAEVEDDAGPPSPTLDDDLEVPSFLRRGRRPTSRD